MPSTNFIYYSCYSFNELFSILVIGPYTMPTNILVERILISAKKFKRKNIIEHSQPTTTCNYNKQQLNIMPSIKFI